MLTGEESDGTILTVRSKRASLERGEEIENFIVQKIKSKKDERQKHNLREGSEEVSGDSEKNTDKKRKRELERG